MCHRTSFYLSPFLSFFHLFSLMIIRIEVGVHHPTPQQRSSVDLKDGHVITIMMLWVPDQGLNPLRECSLTPKMCGMQRDLYRRKRSRLLELHLRPSDHTWRKNWRVPSFQSTSPLVTRVSPHLACIIIVRGSFSHTSLSVVTYLSFTSSCSSGESLRFLFVW